MPTANGRRVKVSDFLGYVKRSSANQPGSIVPYEITRLEHNLVERARTSNGEVDPDTLGELVVKEILRHGPGGRRPLICDVLENVAKHFIGDEEYNRIYLGPYRRVHEVLNGKNAKDLTRNRNYTPKYTIVYGHLAFSG